VVLALQQHQMGDPERLAPITDIELVRRQLRWPAH
jgi:hypothetical protein